MCIPHRVPVGRLAFPEPMASATSSIPMDLDASAFGSTCTLTAYFCDPMTPTSATPLIMDIRFARRFSAYSFTLERDRVGEFSEMMRMGASAGLTFLKEGGESMSSGR